MKHKAISADQSATFSWLIADDESREVIILIKVPPEQQQSAQHDIAELVEMMRTAGLSPLLSESRIRMSRNGAPTVVMTWRGTVNNIFNTESLLSRTAELWEQTAPAIKPIVIDVPPEIGDHS